MFNKILEKITLGGIFLIPLVPLVVTDFLFFPYITGKNFLFRILVEIIFAAWVIWAMKEPSVRPRKSSLLIVAGLFIFFMLMSGIFGEVPGKSLWSNYERMEGVVGYLHVFMFMFVIASVMTKERFKTFFHINLGVAVALASYGLLQHLGVFTISLDGIRVDGTLGNPIYMAVYMLLCLFIALFFLFQNDRESNYKQARASLLVSLNLILVFLLFVLSKVVVGKPWIIYIGIFLVILIDVLFVVFKNKFDRSKNFVSGTIYLLEAIFFLYLVYLTQTRGAALGLIAGLVVACLVLAILDTGRSRKFAVGSLVSIVVLVALFLGIKDTKLIQSDPTLSRLANISLNDTTTSSRLTIWGLAIDGFKEKPILGWGNENFNLIFNKYYEPKLITSEDWFDRSHNILVDWLVQTGLIGLLLYLGLFVSAFYYLFKKSAVFSVKEKALLSGLLIAYLVQNLFVFDNISGIMIFVSVLGYIYVRNFADSPRSPISINPYTYKFVTAVLVVAVVLSLYYVNYRPIKVAYVLHEASKLSGSGKHEEALLKYEKAISLNTFGTREAREHVMMASQRALVDPATSIELKQKFLDVSANEMQLQIDSYAKDARNFVLLGSFLKTYQLYDQALLFLEEAKRLSPRKQSIYQLSADIYLAKQMYSEAIAEAKEAYDFYPESEESAKILALVYMISGDQKSADELLVKHFGSVDVYDPRFLNYYESTNQTDRIIGVWKKYVVDHEEEMLGYIRLYEIYSRAGNDALSKSYLIETIRISEKELARNEKSVDRWVAISDLYVKNGEIDKARDAILTAILLTEKHIDRYKNDFRAYTSLASFYLVVGRGEDAISILQKALNIEGSPKEEINRYISIIAAGGNPWVRQEP